MAMCSCSRTVLCGTCMMHEVRVKEREVVPCFLSLFIFLVLSRTSRLSRFASPDQKEKKGNKEKQREGCKN